jgi:glyoxylase-like metal-dependent hydrolase (beta-lactamase superfamily II)
MDVVELSPSLHFLRFPVGHAYLWADPDGLTLIDTSLPGSGPAIADAIRGLGRQPAEVRRLVLTHAHQDHVGAAAEVAAWGDVTVLAHRADAPVIRGEEARAGARAHRRGAAVVRAGQRAGSGPAPGAGTGGSGAR